MVTFQILSNGNIQISLDEDAKEYIEDRRKEGISDDNIFLELIEPYLCNGYSMVEVALYGGFVLCDGFIDDETPEEEIDDMNMWHFPNYALRSEVECLLEGDIVYMKI